MPANLHTIPLELGAQVLDWLVASDETASLAMLRPAYRVHRLRRPVLQCLANYCRQNYGLVLDVSANQADLFWLLAFFDRQPMRRVEVVAFTAFPKSFANTLFTKGSYNASVSFPIIWGALVRRGVSFASFVEMRAARRLKIQQNTDLCQSRVNSRREFLMTLLDKYNLETMPRTQLSMIRSFIHQMPSLREDVVQAIDEHRMLVRGWASPEFYFPTYESAEPLAIHCSPWNKTWFFAVPRYPGLATIRQHYSLIVRRNGVYQLLFNLDNNLGTRLADLKCTELGDVVILYTGFPWLLCYNEAGVIQMRVKRHCWSIFHKPKQLVVAKSGVNYICDPKAMVVHRILPCGTPVAPIQCFDEPCLVCLHPSDNICVLFSERGGAWYPYVVMYDWSRTQILRIRVSNEHPEAFFCDSLGNWFISDSEKQDTAVNGKAGGGLTIGRTSGYAGRLLTTMDTDDRISFFNREYSTIDSYLSTKKI